MPHGNKNHRKDNGDEKNDEASVQSSLNRQSDNNNNNMQAWKNTLHTTLNITLLSVQRHFYKKSWYFQILWNPYTARNFEMSYLWEKKIS